MCFWIWQKNLKGWIKQFLPFQDHVKTPSTTDRHFDTIVAPPPSTCWAQFHWTKWWVDLYPNVKMAHSYHCMRKIWNSAYIHYIPKCVKVYKMIWKIGGFLVRCWLISPLLQITHILSICRISFIFPLLKRTHKVPQFELGEKFVHVEHLIHKYWRYMHFETPSIYATQDCAKEHTVACLRTQRHESVTDRQMERHLCNDDTTYMEV